MLVPKLYSINRVKPGQNGRHFSDDIFKRIFFYGHDSILMQVSLRFVVEDSIEEQAGLIQIMACRPTFVGRQAIILINYDQILRRYIS